MSAQPLFTPDSGLAEDEGKGATQPPAHPDTKAPKVEPAMQQQQPSVLLSVKNDDRTILTAIIDRTASQKRIINDLRRALSDHSVPYRELDSGIAEAVRTKLKEGVTFEEASICTFGTPGRAGAIRRWRNRWEL